MRSKTLSAIIIGIIALIALGGIYITANPGLLSGRLTGSNPYGLPRNFDIQKCKKVVEKFQQAGGMATYRINQPLGPFTYQNIKACQLTFPEIWYSVIPVERCETLKQWYDEGVLTANLNNQMGEASHCERVRPNIWYGLPSGPYCRQLKDFYDRGILTQVLGNEYNHAVLCKDYYPWIWYAWPISITECTFYRYNLWQNPANNEPNAELCGSTYPDMWNNFADADRCTQLQALADAGTLTPNSYSLMTDWRELSACQQQNP